MNILVCLRAVQDPAGLTINRRAQRVFVNQAAAILNPSDRNALEAALRLGETVIVAAVGGAEADQVLRDALAAGASRAVWVKDAALKSADAGVLARVYQALQEHLGGVDLVLCGAETLDADLGQAAPRLAQRLGWPFIAQVCALSVEAGEVQAVTAHARGFQRVAAALPAVGAVVPDANQPRLAPGARLITVFRDPQAVEKLSCADLGLTEADLQPAAEFRGQAFPPERTPGQRLEGDLDKQAAAAARTLNLFR